MSEQKTKGVEKEGAAQEGQATPQSERAPVPYERFAEVIGERNALKAQLDEAQSAAERASALERDLQAATLATVRLRVAAQSGLPLELAERLQGNDESALQEDAKRLAQYLKPREYGVPPPSGGTPAQLDISQMTPEEIRQHEAELLKRLRL